MKSPSQTSDSSDWNQALSRAATDISEGETGGFHYFLIHFADKLSYNQLITVRNRLVPKIRNKASRVLGGAALKGHAKRFNALFQELQEIMDSKRKKKSEPAFSEEKISQSQDTLAHMHLMYIETASSLKDLDHCFENLIASGRIEKKGMRHNNKTYLVATENGHSGLPDINLDVNEQLLKAFKSKKNELKLKFEEDRFVKEEEKVKKEAAMPGIFYEGDLNGTQLRIYIGYSKKGKKVLRVDQVLSGKKPKFAVGSTYEIGSKSMPEMFRNLCNWDFAFQKIDIELAANAEPEVDQKKAA